MNITVGICQKNEYERMVAIFTEMEEHYYGKGVVELHKMQHYLASRVFAQDSGVTVIRVEQGEGVIGFACINVLYPSPRYSGQMFIKELFISERYRGNGAGKKLMQFIGRLALERECNTLDWMSEKSNDNSRRFYTSLGGEILGGMHHFRLHGAGLKALATG